MIPGTIIHGIMILGTMIRGIMILGIPATHGVGVIHTIVTDGVIRITDMDGDILTMGITGQVIIAVTGTVTMTDITGEAVTTHTIGVTTGPGLMILMEPHTG